MYANDYHRLYQSRVNFRVYDWFNTLYNTEFKYSGSEEFLEKGDNLSLKKLKENMEMAEKEKLP